MSARFAVGRDRARPMSGECFRKRQLKGGLGGYMSSGISAHLKARRTAALLATVVACLLSLWITAGASADSGVVYGPGASKQALVGPAADVFCEGLDPFYDDNSSQPGPGFVVFSQDRSSNTMSVNVVMKRASPNTVYVIRLLQSDGRDCYRPDAILTTNGQGNGQATATERIHSRTRLTQVIVDTGQVFGLPTYRAPDKYGLVNASRNPFAAASTSGGPASRP